MSGPFILLLVELSGFNDVILMPRPEWAADHFKKNIMADQQQQQPNQLNIEISEEVAEGSYANLAIITHSHAEFVIDFVNVMPGTPKSKVKSRIILTPQHAKRFMKALTENIGKYESINGSIKDLEEIQLPMNFGGPTAQA